MSKYEVLKIDDLDRIPSRRDVDVAADPQAARHSRRSA